MRDETQLIATIYLRVTLIFASCKLYSEGGHEHGGQEECGANWAKTLSEAISVDSISVDPSPEKSVDEIPLHACDIEQAFLQADKLPECVLLSTAGTSSSHLLAAPTLTTEMLCTRFAALSRPAQVEDGDFHSTL
jgi:hypothetical protein